MSASAYSAIQNWSRPTSRTSTGYVNANNSCNLCNPRIPDTLRATFSGLAGDFAGYNGTTALSWRDAPGTPCRWDNGNSSPYISLTYQLLGGDMRWYLVIVHAGLCLKGWAAPIEATFTSVTG